MRRTLQDLVGQLAHHLIFLRHVKTIEIYSCASGSIPTLIHSATSSTSKREYVNDQSLLNYFQKKNDLPREVFYEKVLSTPEDKLPTQNYKLEVIVNSYTTVTPIETGRMAQIIGEEIKQIEEDGNESKVEGISANGMETVPANTVDIENNTTTLVHTNTPHTPILSLSTLHISHQETVTYLIVSGLMGGEARRVACEERSRHLKLVPLGAVAACISREGSQSHVRTYMDTSSTGPKRMSSMEAGLAGAVGSCFPPTVGQAFCFLPLPVRTQLPVHVNAYWELSANRRDIWRYASYLIFSPHSSLLCLLSVDCDGRLHGVDCDLFLRLRLSYLSTSLSLFPCP